MATACRLYGDDNILINVTLNVSGSSPYGYGDLLGKGGKTLVAGKKHSGLLFVERIEVARMQSYYPRVRSCLFHSGRHRHRFENCVAEGNMRPTDAMLAETSGPAFERGFASVYRPNVIQPGYMKSLNECGFRTYDSGGPAKRKTGEVTLINCTAKNVRVGFALAGTNKERKPVELHNCAAVGCERGYYLDKAVVENCRGDAKFGPLLYLTGDEPSRIDLTLLPDTSVMKVHAVATLCGKGHEVVIKGNRDKELPILLGFSPPSAGEISLPFGERRTENITLVNSTTMPIVVGRQASHARSPPAVPLPETTARTSQSSTRRKSQLGRERARPRTR